jgi:heme-degrading monooxygenase HmoA
MFVVIFEVQPKPDRGDDYLALGKLLKPELERIDGFIDNERFKSRRTEGRLLSLSTWRDEKAVVRWRTQAKHHGVQEKGRFAVFADYHLRVGEVTADSAAPEALAQQRLDQTEVGTAKAVTISELAAQGSAPPANLAAILALPAGSPHSVRSADLVDHEVFDSIYTQGKALLLASWRDQAAADAWRPTASPGLRHRHVRVVRDYGMHDRREAPQYYPDVARTSLAASPKL